MELHYRQKLPPNRSAFNLLPPLLAARQFAHINASLARVAPGIQPCTPGALAGTNMLFVSGGGSPARSQGFGGGAADSPAHNMVAGLPKIRAAYGKLSDAQGRTLLKALQALQLHERIDWDHMASAVLPDFRRDTLKRCALLAPWLRLASEKVPHSLKVSASGEGGGVRCVGEPDGAAKGLWRDVRTRQVLLQQGSHYGQRVEGPV